MSNHYGLLTIDWAKRDFHYDGIRGLSDDELTFDEVLARVEQHERAPDPNKEVRAIVLFGDTETIIDSCGALRTMMQMEFYTAAQLRDLQVSSEDDAASP